MADLEINVPSFEDFLAEDAKSLSDANHAKHTGDGEGEDLKPVVSDDGSEKKDVVEKSDDAAPGDATGDTLPKPPVS